MKKKQTTKNSQQPRLTARVIKPKKTRKTRQPRKLRKAKRTTALAQMVAVAAQQNPAAPSIQQVFGFGILADADGSSLSNAFLRARWQRLLAEALRTGDLSILFGLTPNDEDITSFIDTNESFLHNRRDLIQEIKKPKQSAQRSVIVTWIINSARMSASCDTLNALQNLIKPGAGIFYANSGSFILLSLGLETSNHLKQVLGLTEQDKLTVAKDLMTADWNTVIRNLRTLEKTIQQRCKRISKYVQAALPSLADAQDDAALIARLDKLSKSHRMPTLSNEFFKHYYYMKTEGFQPSQAYIFALSCQQINSIISEFRGKYPQESIITHQTFEDTKLLMSLRGIHLARLARTEAISDQVCFLDDKYKKINGEPDILQKQHDFFSQYSYLFPNDLHYTVFTYINGHYKQDLPHIIGKGDSYMDSAAILENIRQHCVLFGNARFKMQRAEFQRCTEEKVEFVDTSRQYSYIDFYQDAPYLLLELFRPTMRAIREQFFNEKLYTITEFAQRMKDLVGRKCFNNNPALSDYVEQVLTIYQKKYTLPTQPEQWTTALQQLEEWTETALQQYKDSRCGVKRVMANLYALPKLPGPIAVEQPSSKRKKYICN